MPGQKKKDVGLANANDETKKMVSDMGNAAQGHNIGDEDMEYEEGDFEQTNMDISGSGGDSTRGLGKLKEEGRDEEVSEIASMGGSASQGDESSSEDEE